MKSLSTFFGALILLSACNTSTVKVDSAADDKQQMLEDVAFLASDSLKGRDTGSEGERIAAAYIVLVSDEVLSLQ